MPGRKPAARDDATDVAIRQRDRNTGSNRCALTGGEFDCLRSAQVGTGIAGVRVFGDLRPEEQYFDAVSHMTRVVQTVPKV